MWKLARGLTDQRSRMEIKNFLAVSKPGDRRISSELDCKVGMGIRETLNSFSNGISMFQQLVLDSENPATK